MNSFESARRKLRNRRIRNGLLTAGGLLVVGVGTYLGVKKGVSGMVAQSSSDIQKTLSNIDHNVYQFLNTVGDHYDKQAEFRQNCIDAVEYAIEHKVDFVHYPGIGVRYDRVLPDAP